MQICIEEQLPKVPQTVRPRAMSLYQVVQLLFPLQNITQPFVILFMFFLLFNKACSKYRAVLKKRISQLQNRRITLKLVTPYTFFRQWKEITVSSTV